MSRALVEWWKARRNNVGDVLVRGFHEDGYAAPRAPAEDVMAKVDALAALADAVLDAEEGGELRDACGAKMAGDLYWPKLRAIREHLKEERAE